MRHDGITLRTRSVAEHVKPVILLDVRDLVGRPVVLVGTIDLYRGTPIALDIERHAFNHSKYAAKYCPDYYRRSVSAAQSASSQAMADAPTIDRQGKMRKALTDAASAT